jgi:nucleoside-diphosphate kinase
MLQSTYAMIKPRCEELWGAVFDRIRREGFVIARMKEVKFDGDLVARFYPEHVGQEHYDRMARYITSGVSLGMELVAVDAIARWRNVIGPTAPDVARAQAPGSLRALYARTTTENIVHGSGSLTSALRELGLIFL